MEDRGEAASLIHTSRFKSGVCRVPSRVALKILSASPTWASVFPRPYPSWLPCELRRQDKLVYIEQPEIHLHPAHKSQWPAYWSMPQTAESVSSRRRTAR